MDPRLIRKASKKMKKEQKRLRKTVLINQFKVDPEKVTSNKIKSLEQKIQSFKNRTIRKLDKPYPFSSKNIKLFLSAKEPEDFLDFDRFRSNNGPLHPCLFLLLFDHIHIFICIIKQEIHNHRLDHLVCLFI